REVGERSQAKQKGTLRDGAARRTQARRIFRRGRGPMQSAIRNPFLAQLSAFLYLAICGCANNQVLEIRQLQKQLVDLESRQNFQIQELQHQLERERAAREADMRRVASRVECHSDRVRDFLKECEEGSDVCSENGVANAFQFMITQPYVQIY